MKQIINRLIFTTLAAVLVASGFASCSKSETELTLDRSGVINLSANVQATTHTKAAVNGITFPATTTNVFRLTAFSGASAPTTDWSAMPYFNNIQVNSGTASALTLATAQYYPANGNKVYFYGYAPQATSLTAGDASAAPIANYTITGQEDIMAAQEATGIAATTTGTQLQPTLAFTHKLMQVRFKIVKDVSFESGKKVTNILVKNLRTSAKLDIATGALTFDGAADKTLSLPIVVDTNDEITAGGTAMNGCIMLEPVGAGGSILLTVTADGVVYDNIKVTFKGTNSGTAGTSQLITITFKRTGITTSATITDWATPVDKDMNVDGEGLTLLPVVGDYYYSDGSYSTTLEAGKTAIGLVYYLDPADPQKYKVMALNQALNLKWAASTNYAVSGAQSDTDGKANSAAIKKAFDDKMASIAINETDFAVAFPAAAYCYNYTGKAGTDAPGSWHLPAKSELQYLWCSYNGRVPVSWESNTNTAAAEDVAAQTLWNDRIKKGGGTAGISGDLWSSTEFSTVTSGAWYVYFMHGGTYGYIKSGGYYVRCIKDITPPPPPPVVGDYYYSDGSYSTVLDAGKTATGLIYYLDPANPLKYKVMALEESLELAWVANNSYVVSGARSETDGKSNSAAIKAAFDVTMAGIPITESTFDAAFPAAAYCYNYTGRAGTDANGSWHLPAKNELQYLWCSYNGVVPSSWSDGALFNKNDIAQNSWNDRIEAGGGAAKITPKYLWSSTERNSSNGIALYTSFVNGYTGDYGTSNSFCVRCIRDL